MESFAICAGLPHFPSGLEALAESAEGEDIRIVRTLKERWIDGTDRFDRAGESVLVAVADDTVVGVGALSQCRA